MRYKVTIETRRDYEALGTRPLFLGRVVHGPTHVRRFTREAYDRGYAFALTRDDIQAAYPRHSFDFIHTPV